MVKKETQTEKIEKEYIIPLREKCRITPRYKKTPKAIRTIKEFLARHMKIYDRDLKKIKLDKYLNEFLWARGIKNPPNKIKVKAIKEGDLVKVELFEMPEKMKFKKARREKLLEKAEGKQKKKEKTKETAEEQKISEEKKVEEKEKAKATETAIKEMEKQTAKKMKHASTEKVRQPKRQFRQALQK